MKSPKGKGELLNKLFSYDFGANWLGLGDGIIIKRVKPHIVTLTFPDTGRTFELVARIPREPKAKVAKRPGVAIGQAPAPPAAVAASIVARSNGKSAAKKSPARVSR